MNREPGRLGAAQASDSSAESESFMSQDRRVITVRAARTVDGHCDRSNSGRVTVAIPDSDPASE